MTEVVATIGDLRRRTDATRVVGGRVGLVPTMGYLHAGHRSLLRAARAATDLVVASIFVNPLQFGADEDLDRYPRDLDADVAACEAEGVDVVFAPTVAEMYPAGPPATTVHVDGLTADLCGRARPTHFDGVSTVVAKLFAITGPCAAFFGRKDYQQLVVVSRMAHDLDLPVEVVGCPLVREADGLAMSSRNAYLGSEERAAATVLHRALVDATRAVEQGARDPGAIAGRVRSTITSEPLVAPEYVEVRRAGDLAPLDRLDGEVLVAVAAQVGSTRLIDNVLLTIRGADVRADLGTDLGTGLAPGGRETACTAR